MDIRKIYKLGSGLWLLILLLSAACNTTTSPNIALAAEGNSVLTSGQNLTGATPDEMLAFRWQALARFYEDQILQTRPLTSFTPVEESAYRWQALADFYAGYNPASKPLTEFNAEESLVYRWQAIAQFYR